MQLVDCTAQGIHMRLSGALYPKEVVFKAAYWLTKNYQISIDWNASLATYEVSILPKEDSFNEADLAHLVERFKADLVDFSTRQLIAEETKDIRAILLAKAFANEPDFEAQSELSA